MSPIATKRPDSRSRDRLVAAILALAVPSVALADDSVCPSAPAAGMIQLKVLRPIVNDPTPIIVDLAGPGSGAVQGVTQLGAPDTAGTAVADGSSLVIRTMSPPATAEAASDTMIAVTIAVPQQDPPVTPDPSGAPCAPSTGTVENGAVSITDVQPGGGILPAGSPVAVVGIGFQPGAQVLIDGVSLASTSWVDSSHIKVVTAVEAQLDGRQVVVTNPDLTGATYLSYLRATDLGKSARPLLAATESIFPTGTLSSAVFGAPASGTFFALALQNPGAAEAMVSIDLWDAGSVVASATLALPALTKVSREVSELFPGVVPGAGSAFALTATVPVQMLGLSGNEDDLSVTPVLPALASP